MRPGRLERLLLAGFEPEEIEDIANDLRELAAERGPVGRVVYYWSELAKYPLRRLLDRVRHGGGASTEDRGGGGMGSWTKDTRYAARALARNPGFTVTAIAIITVSMGAATAMFSVIDGVLLEPLPVEEPDRLVSLWLQNTEGRRARMTPGYVSSIAETDGVFEHVAAFATQSASLTTGDGAVFLRGSAVTSAYFETLGVQPVLGRGFRAEEDEPGGPAVVVLSHHIWEQMFGSDPSVLRRSVRLDGFDVQVVGVVPPGVYPTQPTVSAEIPFTTSNQDFFVPLQEGAAMWANYRSHILGMIGRLSPGVTPETARARLAALSTAVQQAEPLAANESVLMTPFTEEVVGDVRFALVMLLGTVSLVLLIAVVNVGALFVLRADDRRGELAVRVALGAPRGRLLRQMLLESGLIVAASSVGALLLGRIVLGAMRSLVPYQIPRLSEVAVDESALLATIGTGLVVALAFGAMPALRLQSGRMAGPVTRARQTSGLRQRRVQGAVVAVQACLAVVVLVGATLLSRSYTELRSVDTGFIAEGAWTMSVPAPLATFEEIVAGVRGLPGVTAAAIAYDHPLARSWGDGFLIEGVERSDTDPPTSAALRPFGEEYFEAAGIAVLAGRVPDRLDMAGEVAYAVVNESFAETFFQDGTALGARLIVPTAQRMLGTDGVYEILGIVANVRFLGPDQSASPAMYLPLSHFPVDAGRLIVRAERDDVAVPAGVRAVVAGIDPTLGVQQARRMEDVLSDLLARPRFNMMLLVSFAAIGLVLCGLGAYGLVGRVVAMRAREIGIRMALGAEASSLARSVIGTALRPMLIGGAVGIVAALGLGRVIQSLLFGVAPTDPTSFAASTAFVVLIGVLAALVPARRAVRVHPASALRAE